MSEMGSQNSNKYLLLQTLGMDEESGSGLDSKRLSYVRKDDPARTLWADTGSTLWQCQ